MDFFEQQEQAKRASRRLLMLFLLSLMCLVLLVNAGVFSAWMLAAPPRPTLALYADDYLGTSLPWWVSLATLVVFSAGPVQRCLHLRRGPLPLADLLRGGTIHGTH